MTIISRVRETAPAVRVLAIAALALAEVSCTSKCWVADSVSVVDSRDGIYLVYRVSGFHDKVKFFEVYRGKPKFDICGTTQMPPVATEIYEREQGLLKKVELHGNALEITYTHNAAEAIEPREARLLE